ncbi:MAG: hypothetical protein N2109_05380 [Fimbriimonadales bacterium]|nr:hypothetical protein [Fimbriimonadales bacterium]
MAVSRKFVWTMVGIVTLGSVVYLNQEPERPKSAGRASRAAATKATDGFTKEDYEAKFPSVALKARNPFVPLVASKRGKGSLAGGIPASLTGGDPNWVYTGMAEIDSVPMALLENRRTGEGVFLKHGEVWNGTRVVSIQPESLVLAGPDGLQRTVGAFTEEPAGGLPGGTVAGGSLPPVTLDPSLRGPIGPALGIQPENSGPQEPGRGRRNRNAAMGGMGGQGANSGIPVY